jgi:hypothetical protein
MTASPQAAQPVQKKEQIQGTQKRHQRKLH